MLVKVRGYKVCNNERNRRVGIACASLAELREKIKEKFEVNRSSFKIFIATDGSEIDDEEYFKTIPEQTVLLVANDNETVISDYDLALSTLNSDLIKVGKSITSFLGSIDSQKVFQLLIQAKNDYKEKVLASRKEDDEKWFEGLYDRNFLTKEEVMQRKSQDRIKSYFYKVKDEVLRSQIYKTDSKAKVILTDVLDCFKYLLIIADYFSCIFNRNHPTRHNYIQNFYDEVDFKFLPKRKKIEIVNFVKRSNSFCDVEHFQKSLCTPSGDFYCMGRFSDTICQYNDNQMHSINPYSSKENLILFQTWNLDHQIEFSRAIIPSLLKNVSNIVSSKAICKKHRIKACQVSVVTYFKEFFTLDNLKLVHIVCHDKNCHDLESKGTVICSKCEEYKFISSLKELAEDKT